MSIHRLKLTSISIITAAGLFAAAAQSPAGADFAHSGQTFDSSPLSKSDGGMNSGGGNFVVLPGGEMILLDLYIKDPTLSFMTNSKQGLKLPNSEAFESLGLERVLTSDPLIQKAKAVAHHWSKNAPRISELLIKALEKTPFLYMKYDFNFRDENFVLSLGEKAQIGNSQIKTAAVYVKSLGVLFSKLDIDSLNEVNQVAVLIHESLRHLQIGYGYVLSNESLQKLTASLVLDDPSRTPSLDRYLLLAQPKDASEKLKASVCAALKKYPLEGYSCLALRGLAGRQQSIDYSMNVADAMDTLVPELKNVRQLQEFGRFQHAVRSAIGELVVEQIQHAVDDGERVANEGIVDVILETKLVGVSDALTHPASPKYKAAVNGIFKSLLNSGTLRQRK